MLIAWALLAPEEPPVIFDEFISKFPDPECVIGIQLLVPPLIFPVLI
jgi:hypothetical protein